MSEVDETKRVVTLKQTEDDPKTPLIACEVPRGALIPVQGGEDGERKVLNRVVLRELKGHEEDILSNENIGITDRLNQVVCRCIVSISDGETTIKDRKSLDQLIDTHPWGLTLGDVLTLLFRLREVTIGDEFRQIVVCPVCRDEQDNPYSWTHIGSMKDYSVVPCKGDPTEHTRVATTSRGAVVRWTMLTAARQSDFAKKQMPKDKGTRTLLMRVDTIDDKPATKENLKDLSFMERTEIRGWFDEEGGIDTMIQLVCGNCGHEFSVQSRIDGQDFFLPSVTSES